MASLEQQILSIIEAQLPEATAGVLKSYLKDSENLKEENQNLKNKINELENKRKDLILENSNLSTRVVVLQNNQETIEKREKEVSEKEINLEINNLKIKLESQEKITEAIYSLVEKVFRNPTFVKQEAGNMPLIHHYNSNGNTSSYSENRVVDLITKTTVE